jgi:hypothetical protein
MDLDVHLHAPIVLIQEKASRWAVGSPRARIDAVGKRNVPTPALNGNPGIQSIHNLVIILSSSASDWLTD